VDVRRGCVDAQSREPRPAGEGTGGRD
jgi:hypothetical protein